MVQPAERADARANRLRLLDAAQELFRERGLDAEMKEIAERAGLGVGTIYRNFPTKDDLIAAIIGRVIAEIEAANGAAVAMPDPIEGVRFILRSGFTITERYGDILMAMMEGRLPPSCNEQFEQLDGISHVATVVRRGMDAGLFRATLDAELAAAHLIAAFVPWHYQQLRRSRTLDEIVDGYADLWLRGTLADGAAGRRHAAHPEPA